MKKQRNLSYPSCKNGGSGLKETRCSQNRLEILKVEGRRGQQSFGQVGELERNLKRMRWMMTRTSLYLTAACIHGREDELHQEGEGESSWERIGLRERSPFPKIQVENERKMKKLGIYTLIK